MSARCNFHLMCGHRVMRIASQVTHIYCPQCNESRRVYDVIMKEVKTRCRQCPYSRWHGLDVAAAKSTANKHAASKHGHTMDYVVMPNPHAVKVREKLLENCLIGPLSGAALGALQ